MEFIRQADVAVLGNASISSYQLLSPGNSASRRVTITRVVLAPGAINRRHTHPASEQTWIALRGSGSLLLAGDATAPFAEGDVVRFEPGEVHGLRNSGAAEFEYLAVTSPPLDFRGAYEERPDADESSTG